MHTRAVVVSVVTVVGLAAAAASLPSRAQGALKPVDAMIVNPPSRPVPVTVLGDEGGRELFRIADALNVELGFGCAAIAVPAGKRMVVQHLGGQATVNAPAALLAVVTRLGSASFSDLVVPAAPPLGAAGFPNSSAAGQQVHAYYDHNFQVCASLSLEASGRVGYYLRGYLVNKP
jgi:hypothetical protein